MIKDARELPGTNLECKTRLNGATMLPRESVEGFLKLCRNYDSSYIVSILS